MSAEDRRRPLIFGEVLFDHFPDGSVVLGGAPFNTAWHLQAFGQAPLLISRVGDDPLGRRIRSAMLDWGMDTSGLQLDSAHPTGTVDVSIEDGEPRFDIVADRAYDFIDAASFPPVDDAGLLYHGSLALRRAESRAALEALRTRSAAPVFLDVNLRAPWWDAERARDMLRHARWAKLNEVELKDLSTERGGLAQQAAALQEQMQLELLVITLGARGALVRTADGDSLQVAPGAATQLMDAVGAGDAFASVFMLGLLSRWSYPLILERAQTFASAIVGVRGATVGDTGFYAPFRQQWGL